MAHLALGEVKPASTSVATRATNNCASLGISLDSAQAVFGQAISFQALASQAGGILICEAKSGSAPSTTVNVIYRIPPRTNGLDFSFSIGHPGTPRGVNAADYYILPEVSGEGVRISLLE